MIERKTQSGAYWQEEFSLTAKDLSWIYDKLLDEGRPVPTTTLVSQLFERRCRAEEQSIKAELSKGPVYQPQQSYEVGQQVLFAGLEYQLGTVVAKRPGRNPEYGQFTVIQVQFSEPNRLREFASELKGDHKLIRSRGEADLLSTADLQTPDELLERFGDAVRQKLVATLSSSAEYVRFGDNWFLGELLVEVGQVQLNIAEALIEIKGMPLATADLLRDLDLPGEVAEEIRVLSLNRALSVDGRFSNVGDGGRDVWYLRRLTPQEVLEPPFRLTIRKERFNRSDISKELLAIEREIEDEGSGEEVLGTARPAYRAAVTLIYPHWRYGTLPLSVRTEGLFPKPTVGHTPVVLVDAQSGDRMQGWVARDSSIVYGLAGWYKRYQLPVGAYIKIERTRDPRVITVDYDVQRLKRLWVKVAAVQGGDLVFQMRKAPLSCGFDDLIIIADDSPSDTDVLAAEVERNGDTLFDVMVRLLPELVKLSPQGTVHAKTIYSAVNILLRTPPGPVFALLSTEPCFTSMGGGYWTFDPTLL